MQIQLKSLAEEMQAINKGLEKVEQELTISENDGPVSEIFRKVTITVVFFLFFLKYALVTNDCNCLTAM